jgi:microcystin-dependent protein
VASGGPGLVKTGAYTITVADILGGNKFLYNSASPGTFTLPTSSLVDGMVVNVAQIGAGALTVSGGTRVGTTVTTAQYQGLSFVYVASGTTWYSIAPSATAPGLAVIAPTTIDNTGGSVTATGGQIVLSAVNSVSLNGIFTSTYDNYQLVFSGALSSVGSVELRARFRVGGTDNTTTNYYSQYVQGNSTTVTGARETTQTSFLFAYCNNALPNQAIADICEPYLTKATSMTTSNLISTGGPNVLYYGQMHLGATSFDGITIYPASGTLSGTVRIYGLKNS